MSYAKCWPPGSSINLNYPTPGKTAIATTTTIDKTTSRNHMNLFSVQYSWIIISWRINTYLTQTVKKCLVLINREVIYFIVVPWCNMCQHSQHEEIIKRKHFPHYWPFVRGIQQSPVNSPVNSPHKGQWHGTLMVSLICAWINGWGNNREADDLRCHRAHYDVTVMINFGWGYRNCKNAHNIINKIAVKYVLEKWESFSRLMNSNVGASRRRDDKETLPHFLAFWEWSPPVSDGSHHKGPVMRSFDVSFGESLNKLLKLINNLLSGLSYGTPIGYHIRRRIKLFLSRLILSASDIHVASLWWLPHSQCGRSWGVRFPWILLWLPQPSDRCLGWSRWSPNHWDSVLVGRINGGSEM